MPWQLSIFSCSFSMLPFNFLKSVTSTAYSRRKQSVNDSFDVAKLQSVSIPSDSLDLLFPVFYLQIRADLNGTMQHVVWCKSIDLIKATTCSRLLRTT